MIRSPVKFAGLALVAASLVTGPAHAASCVNPILNTNGLAATKVAARAAALNRWKQVVTSTWGAVYANYSLARYRSSRCWPTTKTVGGKTSSVFYCRVAGRPCRLVFKKGMKLKPIKRRGQ